MRKHTDSFLRFASLALALAGFAKAQFIHTNSTIGGIQAYTVAADLANNKVVALDGSGFTRDLVYTTSGAAWGPQNIAFPAGVSGTAQLVTRGTGPTSELTLVIKSATQPIRIFRIIGGQWSQITTSNAPVLRLGEVGSMPNGDLIAFGGYVGGVTSNQTFRLSGTTWSLLSPATSPPARAELAMTSNQTGVVIFGGSAGGLSTLMNDMWQFDGVTWSQIPVPTNGPAPRADAGFAFRPSNGEFTVVSGIGANGVLLDTWHLTTSNTWITPSFGAPIPFAQGSCQSAVEPVHNEVITVLGNSGPTMVDSVSGFRPFGLGCDCFGGTGPSFTIAQDPFVTGASINAYNYVLPSNLDLSRPSFLAWGTGPSGPFQIPGFAAGCNILMSNVVAIETSFGVTVPNAHTLRGLQLVYQGVQFPDTGFGGCVSNAVEVWLGF
ncbi:MAG: hypothetical protein ACK6DT_05960 [Planctomycetota bacterium]